MPALTSPRVRLSRIKPAYCPIAATVDYINTRACRMLKDNQRRPGQIELRDRRRDRERPKRLRPLSHHDRTVIDWRLGFVVRRRLDYKFGELQPLPRLYRGFVAAGVFFQTLLVAPEPALDLVGGLLEARVGLVRPPLGLQIHARAEVQRAIGAKGRTLRRHHDM